MVKKQLCKSNLPVKGSKNRNAHFSYGCPFSYCSNSQYYASFLQVKSLYLLYLGRIPRLGILPVISQWEVLLFMELTPHWEKKI